MKKYFGVLCLAILVLAVACAPKQQETSTPPQNGVNPPAAGDVDKEPVVAEPEQQVPSEQNIPQDVLDLLDKSQKVKSIYYKYRGPGTGNDFFEFYVKGANIKYKPARELRSLDQKESYDSIFINKDAKSAASYCEAAYCAYQGQKEDLVYDEAYIKTVFDWIGEIKEAEKIGEEVIDSRNTWKIQADNGILWIDTFYGIPLKVESGGETYRFEQIAVNGVKDSDVLPS